MIVPRSFLWALPFLLLTCCYITLKGQTKELYAQYNLNYELPDSMLAKINSLSRKKDKATYLLNQVKEQQSINSNLALFLIDQALPFAKGKSSNLVRAQLHYWKAHILSWHNPESAQLQIALTEAQYALEEFQRLKVTIWEAKSNNIISLIHFYQEKYELADGAINASFRLIEDSPAPDLIWRELQSEALRIKGNILLYQLPTIDSSLTLYKESQTFYEEVKDSLQLAALLLNQGIALAQFDTTASQEIHASAGRYYLDAIDIYQNQGNKEDLAVAYLEYATYLADIFWLTQAPEDFKRSNSYLLRALSLQPTRTAELYYQLGSNYQSLSSWNSNPELDGKALLDTAAIFYDSTMLRAISEENIPYFKLATESIESICPFLKKKLTCTKLLEKVNFNYENILGAVLAVKDTVSVINLAFTDELAQRKQRQMLTWTIGSALGLLGGVSFLYYRSRLKNLNKALENKMEALRAQMNPHFISNSLNAIDSLINQERNEEASEYIIDFSRLCRLVLNHSKEKWITLEEEIETLEYFITLEKLRLGDNLTYSIDVDDELNQSDIQIPPMLLQPFVENAIWHGIQKKQAPGHLEVAVFKNALGQLECQITDDGIGRKKAQELQKESVLERQSWGMQITKERMEAVKKIEGSVLEISDLKPDDLMPGTKVSIKFPLLPFKPEKI